MQIKSRRTSLAETKRQEQCCHAAHPEENLRHRSHSPDTFIGHSQAPRSYQAIPRAHRFRLLQILARDPAGNQYP